MLLVLKKTSQWDGSFEHLEQMLKHMDKIKSTILRSEFSIEIEHPSGFPQALEIMENLENLENYKRKFNAWKNHGIWKKLNNHGKIMEFCKIIWRNH